jgi:hypothetical protein
VTRRFDAGGIDARARILVAMTPLEHLEHVLHRSTELKQALVDALHQAPGLDGSERGQASAMLCNLSVEHADSVRVLVSQPLPTSAVAMLRIQYECVVRAIWAAYAADAKDLSRLLSVLTPENAQSASKLPNLSKMIDQLDARGAPPVAVDMLKDFRDNNWNALNSYVHGGLHALNRQQTGMPLQLLVHLVQFSNGLLIMAAMMLAKLTDEDAISQAVARAQLAFADCLPDTRSA